MPESNDYVNWVVTHTAQEENHKKNTELKKKKYNSKEAEYSITEYDNNRMTPYKHTLAEVFKDGDPKWQNMTPKELHEQARIQLEKHQYDTKTNDNYYVRVPNSQ